MSLVLQTTGANHHCDKATQQGHKVIFISQDLFFSSLQLLSSFLLRFWALVSCVSVVLEPVEEQIKDLKMSNIRLSTRVLVM